MAGGQERVLKRRIRSVNSTKKITRAMELIAASRIVKAQARVHAAAPYADAITEVVKDVAGADAQESSPLLVSRPRVRTIAQVIFTADRGLCGSYNSQIIRSAEGEIKADVEAGYKYGLVCIGRKGEGHFRFQNYNINAAFSGFSDSPRYENARAVADDIMERYIKGEFDRVQLIYTRFVSAGFQEVVTRPLLPLDRELVEGGDAHSDEVGATYSFEPSPSAILDALLPRYVEARVYAALLNAAASEHAARQRAMKAATDNADDLIVTLTRVMNRARQDAITTEIMEVVGGAEALRGEKKHPLEEELVGAAT